MSGTSAVLGKALSLLAGFVAVSVVAGFLIAGLALPSVGVTGSLARGGVDFFDSLPTEFDEQPLSEQSVLYGLRGGKPVRIASFYDENRVSVALKSIAPVMRQAIVAIEDSRFYEHGGIDPKGVLRAAAVNWATGTSSQGASTLTQQYVKNVRVEEAAAAGDQQGVDEARDKNIGRKLREMKIAISLEKKLTKDEILNRYLNIALFGDSAYGVEAASRYFFNKHASQLSLPEAATLAGLVQSPGWYNPRRFPDRAKARRNVVLQRMYELKYIDLASYTAASRSPLKITLTKIRSGCANAGVYAYYCDYVKDQITDNKAFSPLGKTPQDRAKKLARGGLLIQTPLDVDLLRQSNAILNQKIPPTDASKIGTAAVTVEPGTGKVLAMTQNRIYDPQAGPGRTAVNYSTDNAYGGSNGFQTGSTFKTFTLAEWLTQGKSLGDVVNAVERTRKAREFTSCGAPLSGADYAPRNSADGEGTGAMPVLRATYDSVNTAFVDIESRLDLCDIANLAGKMGVHMAEPQQECGKLSDSFPTCLMSLTLGVKEIAPLTMAAGYATFAAGGVYCSPIVVTSIKDRSGKTLLTPKSSCTQAVTPQVAAGVSYALQRVISQGTAAGVPKIGRPAAGKTGTTNDYGDTWFIGYTPQRSTAVWVGAPDTLKLSNGNHVRRQLRKITINGHYYSRVFGATIAAPIWSSIMKLANAGLPAVGFPSPPAKMLLGQVSRVPDVAGRGVNTARGILAGAGFNATVAPGGVNSGYPAGTVAYTSPGAGSKMTVGGTVVIYLSNGTPNPQPTPTPSPGGGGGGGGGHGGGQGGGGGPPH